MGERHRGEEEKEEEEGEAYSQLRGEFPLELGDSLLNVLHTGIELGVGRPGDEIAQNRVESGVPLLHRFAEPGHALIGRPSDGGRHALKLADELLRLLLIILVLGAQAQCLLVGDEGQVARFQL